MRADRPARPATEAEIFFVGDEFQSIYRFRHADVEVFRERRDAGRRRARPDPELPLAARGARRDQPPLRGRLRRHVPAARGRGPLPGPRLRAGGRAARDRQGELRGDRRPLAQGRGAPHRARASRPRRLRRGDAGRDRPALRGRARTPSPTRRSCARSACRPSARPAATTTASSRWSTSSTTCGCCTTATTTRRCSACSPRRSSASRTTGSCCCGGRRRAAPLRRAREGVSGRRLRAGRAALPGLQAALRPARRADAVAVARAALRADRRRARLRPRRAGAVGRPPPVREPAQARADGALVRGAARARRTGLRALRRRAGRGRCVASSRRSPRRKAPT